MAAWSMDNWRYVERQAVTDPKGRQWSVALMDILGQEGDPEMPSKLLELQYSSGRFFTLIYSESGVVVWERGHTSLPRGDNHLRALDRGCHGWRPRSIAARVSGRFGRLKIRRVLSSEALE